eukprot:gene24931-10582_t
MTMQPAECFVLAIYVAKTFKQGDWISAPSPAQLDQDRAKRALMQKIATRLISLKGSQASQKWLMDVWLEGNSGRAALWDKARREKKQLLSELHQMVLNDSDGIFKVTSINAEGDRTISINMETLTKAGIEVLLSFADQIWSPTISKDMWACSELAKAILTDQSEGKKSGNPFSIALASAEELENKLLQHVGASWYDPLVLTLFYPLNRGAADQVVEIFFSMSMMGSAPAIVLDVEALINEFVDPDEENNNS